MGKTGGQIGAGLTTRRLLVALLFVAIFAMASRQPADSDTWWHLKSGQLIWETGQLPRTDAFSHTVAGQPWIDHGWLVQAFLWPVYRASGLAGLALLLAAIVTATFALVYGQCEGRPFVAAFATLLAAVASSIVWAIRPQIFSLLLAALVAWLLDRYKRTGDSRLLFLLPPIVALWVNCHGGFVIAFILIGCHLVGETMDRLTSRALPTQHKILPLAMAALACVPAILLNPNTTRMIPYAFQTVNIGPLKAFIQEWASPDFHNLQFHPFIWLLLLTLAAVGLSRRRAGWTGLALVGVFGYMGLLAARNIALFAVVAAPVLARHTVAALDEMASDNPRLSWFAALTRAPSLHPRRSHALLNIALLAVVVAGAGLKVGVDLARMSDPEFWGRGLPVKAATYLNEHELSGKMFNTYNWGGYLIWSLYPEQPVFVDGRTDLYAFGGSVLDDYVTVHWTRPGWQQVLDQYVIGFVLTERSGPLDTMLAQTASWRRVYEDPLAVIHVRAEGEP